MGGCCGSSAPVAVLSGDLAVLNGIASPSKPSGKKYTREDLQLGPCLGIGNFSRVRIAVPKVEDGAANAGEPKPMVLKIMMKRDMIRMEQVENVLSEIEILRLISHPFVVNMVGAFQDDTKLFVLMEFANRGEIQNQISAEGNLPPERCQFYAAELVLVLAHLHSRNIIYRDLKPQNVLVSFDGHIKVCDFGFAKLLKEGRAYTFLGTPEYMAPEIVRRKDLVKGEGESYGKPVDWWALGCLLHEMLEACTPFIGESQEDIFENTTTASKSGFVDIGKLGGDASASKLLKGLLEPDARKRLCSSSGAVELDGYQFFKTIDWTQLLRGAVQPPYTPREVKEEKDVGMSKDYSGEIQEDESHKLTAEEQERFARFSTDSEAVSQSV